MYATDHGSGGGALGVVVPEGDPGALHDAAAALTSIAGVLEHVGGELARGTPAGWYGSAAMNFQNACVTEGSVATRGAGAMDVASHALHGLARDLADAQKACRHQVALAREAKARGDKARVAAQEASNRANAERLSAAAAAKRASMAEMGGLPSGPERTAQAQSSSRALDADGEFQAQQSKAEAADGHLHDAQRVAREKAHRYEESARHAASILRGLAGQAPTVAAVNGHPVAATGGPGRPPGLAVVQPKPPQPAKEEKHHGGLGGLLHTALDGIGLIPVIGEPADGINGAIYAAEGDKVNAALSLSAMIPIAGDAVTGGKYAVKGAKGVEKLAEGAKDAEKARDAEKAAAAGADGLTRGEQLLGKSGDTVVLGRQADTATAKGWGNHVVLDTPEWSLKLNDEFIAGAVKQRRRIYLASPTKGNLIQDSGPFAGKETIYARELRQLKQAGYRRNGDYLEPPQ